MKIKLLSLAIVALLSGCVVAPVPDGRVVVQPAPVEIVYVWDPYMSRYYYVDRGARIYMAPGWVHPGRSHGRSHRHW